MVKIVDFSKQPNLEDVDLVDDLHFFMHNDPTVYRRILFPLISALKKNVKSGATHDEEHFKDGVDKAATLYCKKFNIADNPKSVFTDVDRDELARKIFWQEKDNIAKGVYDGDKE